MFSDYHSIAFNRCTFSFDIYVTFSHILPYLLSTAARRKVIKGDSSLMTYRGHGVLHTLIRCYFSPQFSTGQVGTIGCMWMWSHPHLHIYTGRGVTSYAN